MYVSRCNVIRYLLTLKRTVPTIYGRDPLFQARALASWTWQCLTLTVTRTRSSHWWCRSQTSCGTSSTPLWRWVSTRSTSSSPARLSPTVPLASASRQVRHRAVAADVIFSCRHVCCLQLCRLWSEIAFVYEQMWVTLLFCKTFNFFIYDCL